LKKSTFIKAVSTKAASIRSCVRGTIKQKDFIAEAEALKNTIENCL
jgi:hypothetical protein